MSEASVERMNNNVVNKEAIQLLNGSSDSDSASDIQFTLAPQPTVQVRRKIRTKRYSNANHLTIKLISPYLQEIQKRCIKKSFNTLPSGLFSIQHLKSGWCDICNWRDISLGMDCDAITLQHSRAFKQD